jgi:mRNA-degrading endonuclease RelE of RelBE toxin-antitoxin system
MNGWTIELSKSAQRELRLLEDGPRQAAIDLLEDLRESGPALASAISLRGHKDVWRARFHQERYRMIYRIAKGQKRIVVGRIRIRAVAYKGMRH